MSELKYKTETLDLINQLSTTISNGIVMTKDEAGKNIIINRTNPSESVTFFFTAPIEDFSFEGDEIAIYHFPEFFQLFSVFKEPKIVQELNKLTISKGASKIKYVLSDTEALSNSPKGCNIDVDPDTKFELTEEELKNFSKMINLVNSEKASIQIVGKSLILKLGNESHENSYEKKFDLVNEAEEEFKFEIPAEVFTVIPTGAYDVSIWKDGIITFDLKSSKVSLKILTAELEDE